MGASRLTANALGTAPVVLVALLAGWAFWDFLGIPETALTRGFVALLIVGMGALVLGLRFEWPSIRRAGLAFLAVSYLGAHISVLPLDPAAALGFVTLLLVVLELRILAERFGPVFSADLDEEDRARLEDALSHALLRLVAASAIAYLGSYLTADLALSGALPLRSTATALFLSLGLIAVVLLLAYWPAIESRMRFAAETERVIQTPK